MSEYLLIFQNYSIYIRPALEILLLSVIIYYCLYFLRETRALYILSGLVIILIVLTIFSNSLKLEVLNWLINNLWAMLAIGVVVIFQPELRNLFAQLGSTPFSSRKRKQKEALNEVVNGLINLSRQKIGALVVFERQIGMRPLIDTGIVLDCRISRHIVESIFFPNSPLHDGAVIIKNNKIMAAHVILPLSEDESLTRTLGTRHRAAIGITEETDAIAVVVSEETGYISIACKGRMRRNIRKDKLLRYLRGLLASDQDSLQTILEGMQTQYENLDT